MADSDVAKSDPSAEQTAAPGPTLAKDETNKVTTGVTEEPKTSEAKPAPSITEQVSSAASTATSAVKDNVFSMFGGGPTKEKKEEQGDVDEPSGSSKAKATDVGSICNLTHTTC